MFLKHAFASLIVVGTGAAVAHSVAGASDRAFVLAQAPPSAQPQAREESDKKNQREERAKGTQEHTNQERARGAQHQEKQKQERARAEQERAKAAQEQQRQHEERTRAVQEKVRADQEKQKQERARAEQERTKAAQEQQRQHEERTRAAQEKVRADQEKQKQERARAEQERTKAAQEQQRQRGERERAAREKAQAESRQKEGATKSGQEGAASQQGQTEELNRVEQDRLKRERTKLDRDRARVEQERARLETERVRAVESKQAERNARVREDLKRRDERLKAEENQLKVTDERLRQREERTRAERERQRTKEGVLREREQGLERSERRLERLADIQRQRVERVEAGRRIIEEPDKRIIVKDQGWTIIRHDETERLRHVARDLRTEQRRDGIVVSFFTKPDGTEIVSEVDDKGRLVRRYRRSREGREIVLIDNRRWFRPDRPMSFVDAPVRLPPLSLRIPRERYIVEYSRASEGDLYDTLVAPPVEQLTRAYSLEEIRFSQPLRERMRRVDLDDINFEFGSWEVTPDQMPKLERLASAIKRVLDRQPNEVLLIEGHTDAVGSAEDNLTLSDRRAEAVATVLTQTFEVPPENLVTQGYGEQFLKINTQDPERANRRVALRRITPLLGRG